MMKVVAIIPARSGSKRFKDKNTFYIGIFPDLSVDDARKIALNYKNKIAHGLDPISNSQSPNNGDITFGVMFNSYTNSHL